MTGTTIHIPTLTTARLTLRAHVLSDFDLYAETLGSARMVHIDRLDRRDAWFVFANDIAGWQVHGFGLWAVDLHDGAPVGQVGIQKPAHFPEPELGWVLHAGQEGRGYATEAALAALAWAKGRIDALVSYIAPANARSVAVARRLGARRDAEAALPWDKTPQTTHVYRHWGAPA